MSAFSDSGCEVCTSAGASLRFEVVGMGRCRTIVMRSWLRQLTHDINYHVIARGTII